MRLQAREKPYEGVRKHGRRRKIGSVQEKAFERKRKNVRGGRLPEKEEGCERRRKGAKQGGRVGDKENACETRSKRARGESAQGESARDEKMRERAHARKLTSNAMHFRSQSPHDSDEYDCLFTEGAKETYRQTNGQTRSRITLLRKGSIFIRE